MSIALPTSVYGNDLSSSIPLAFSVTTSSSAAKALIPGCYVLSCDVDCWVTIGVDGTVVAAAPASTQGGSPGTTRTIRLQAGVPRGVPITGQWVGGSPNIAVITLAGSGTFSAEGPMRIEPGGS